MTQQTHKDLPSVGLISGFQQQMRMRVQTGGAKCWFLLMGLGPPSLVKTGFHPQI